jgi:hypothetical protein
VVSYEGDKSPPSCLEAECHCVGVLSRSTASRSIRVVFLPSVRTDFRVEAQHEYELWHLARFKTWSMQLGVLVRA